MNPCDSEQADEFCSNRMDGLMASSNRTTLQEQVWWEILNALKTKAPEVEQLSMKSRKRRERE